MDPSPWAQQALMTKRRLYLEERTSAPFRRQAHITGWSRSIRSGFGLRTALSRRELRRGGGHVDWFGRTSYESPTSATPSSSRAGPRNGAGCAAGGDCRHGQARRPVRVCRFRRGSWLGRAMRPPHEPNYLLRVLWVRPFAGHLVMEWAG